MQVSWIDPEEIARLAAELNGPLPAPEAPSFWDVNTIPEITADALMPPPNEQAPSVPEPAAPPAAHPPAHQPQLDHIRERLRAIRSRAQEAGILPKKEEAAPPPTPEPTPPPAAEEPVPTAPPQSVGENSPPPASPRTFLNLDGTLTERLASFMTWSAQYAPSKEILLVDDHGELLWGNPSHPELALSAILAANASLRAGAQSLSQQPAAALQLSPERHLTVIPCTTRLGLVTLALLNASPLLTDEQVLCLREALTLSVEGKTDGQ